MKSGTEKREDKVTLKLELQVKKQKKEYRKVKRPITGPKLKKLKIISWSDD